MTTENELCTFVASVRMDLRDIATIAQFLASRNIFVGTRSKIASEIIRIMARGASDEFQIKKHIDAVRVLSQLGYDASLIKGTKYYRTLMNEISTEESQESLTEAAIRLTKNFSGNPSSGTPATLDKAAMQSVLVPAEPEPKPETPQLKVRTPEDEKADISKLRKGLMEGAPVEVLEKNKT